MPIKKRLDKIAFSKFEKQFGNNGLVKSSSLITKGRRALIEARISETDHEKAMKDLPIRIDRTPVVLAFV